MWTERRSGQNHQRGKQDHRDPFERDRTRVIHCAAFRRLQRKTQILATGEGDFHRTRLTHSLEVASIGSSIVRSLLIHHRDSELGGLLPSDDSINVICLLHDIGHPPFGHGGEVALNYMMRASGGFEGNAQTLRLLTKIETSYGDFGLDLTRRSLLGILKYPVPWSMVEAFDKSNHHTARSLTIRVNDWLPPKAYFDEEQAVVDWILKPFIQADRDLFQSLRVAPTHNQHGKSAYRTLDCSIMDMADDIAYGVHDLEDAIHLRLIGRDHIDSKEFCQLLKATSLMVKPDAFIHALFSVDLHERKEAIGELVNYFIGSIQMVIANDCFDNPLLRYNAELRVEAKALLNAFKTCIYRYVIDSQEARTFEYGGQTVVQRLFEAFSSNPENLLDGKNRELFHQADSDQSAMRVICDYIANMTDEYAHRMHERLFGFNTRTIFERL